MSTGISIVCSNVTKVIQRFKGRHVKVKRLCPKIINKQKPLQKYANPLQPPFPRKTQGSYNPAHREGLV